MDYWVVSGILLAGCGIGALLTAAVYLTQLRKIKAELYRASHANPQGPTQISSNPDNKRREERSA